jgi:carotenoid cleavage dioxygenase-like enzyme
MHPLLQHAMIERRGFLRGAVAAGLAAGAGASLLSCASDRSGGATASMAGSVVPTTSLPPVPFDPELPYWMQGGFAPVDEEVEVVDLEVTGSLPPELDGLYVRNGSNPSNGPSTHWFLGDGMVHGVRLGGGAALWYRNRYVDTPLYRSGRGLLGAAPGGENNQSNVSVFHHGGRLLSSGEIGLPYELSTEDLSTVGVHDHAGALTTAMTAHPKIDPVTGRMHFFGYGFVPPYLTYHVAAPDGTLEYSAEIEVAGPTMIHDFAITDTDAVFWELPVVFDMDAAVASVTSPDGGFPFRWEPSYGARIGIMPLDGPTSAIRWVEIDPCYVFHGVNAHRVGDEVVVDVCVMPQIFGQGGDDQISIPHRWTIDTSGDAMTVRQDRLTERPMDLPAIDRRFAGRPSRHAWYLVTEPDGDFPIEFAGISRRDERTGRLDGYFPGPSERVNEGVVVPVGEPEGEGWLLTYAWDRARGASDLLVLDALDMAAGPVARVHLPVRVPYGFHGTWVPLPA